MRKIFLLSFTLIILIVTLISLISVSSHIEEFEEEDFSDKSQSSKSRSEKIHNQAFVAIIIASLLSGSFVIFSLIVNKKKTEKQKWFLFIAISIPIVIATLFSAISTVYLNVRSETGGPVHWHADFEILNCENKVNLVDPEGIMNRVGNPVFHEHGDDRIHVEGVITDVRDADLHSFIDVVGGSLTDDELIVPTNEGLIAVNDGDLCNGKFGKVQIFLYSIVDAYSSQNDNFVYEQKKIAADYVLSPYSNVPPGDCIIIEFDEEKEFTDKICEPYRIAIEQGKMKKVDTDGS